MKPRIANWLLIFSITLNIGAIGAANVAPGANKKCIVTPVFGFGHDCNCDGAPGPNNFIACNMSYPQMGAMFVTDFQCIDMQNFSCADAQVSCGERRLCDRMLGGPCNAMNRSCTLQPNVMCNEQFGCQ